MNWRCGSLQWGFNTGSCGRRPPVLRDHWIIALVMRRWVKIGPLSDMNKAAEGQSVFVFVVRLVGDFLLIRAVEPRYDARHPQMCHLHWLLSGFPHGEVQQQTLLVHHHISQTSKQTTNNNKKTKTRRTPRTSSLNLLHFNERGSGHPARDRFSITGDLRLHSATWIVKCGAVYYDSNYSATSPRHQRDGLNNRQHVFCLIQGLFLSSFQSKRVLFCLVPSASSFRGECP